MVYATTVYVPPALPPCIAKRFSDFLRAIGKPLAGFPYSKTGDVTFRPKDYRCWRRPTRYLYTLHAGRYDLRVASYGFTYGLTTYEDITKKGFWIPKDSSLMATARLGPFPDYNNTLDVTAYACFGIKHGKGWYFYACGYGSSGVSPDTYAKCVSEALRGTPSGGKPAPSPGPGPGTPSPGCDPGKCASPRPTLQRGATDSCVGLAQQLLTNQGQNPGPVDCIFGQLTEAAVVHFQKAKGLTATGIIDSKTWAALEAPVITDKDKCLKAGGTWDEATKTCKLGGGKRPVPYLLYAGIGVAALLAAVAGYSLIAGRGEE